MALDGEEVLIILQQDRAINVSPYVFIPLYQHLRFGEEESKWTIE